LRKNCSSIATNHRLRDDDSTNRANSGFLEWTNANSHGIAKDLPVVGRWRSKECGAFYLAPGVILHKQGNPVRKKEAK
jgi:hypothetical protein